MISNQKNLVLLCFCVFLFVGLNKSSHNSGTTHSYSFHLSEQFLLFHFLGLTNLLYFTCDSFCKRSACRTDPKSNSSEREKAFQTRFVDLCHFRGEDVSRLCLRGQMTPSESEGEVVAEQDLAPLSPWWHVPLPGTVCVPELLCFSQ